MRFCKNFHKNNYHIESAVSSNMMKHYLVYAFYKSERKNLMMNIENFTRRTSMEEKSRSSKGSNGEKIRSCSFIRKKVVPNVEEYDTS